MAQSPKISMADLNAMSLAELKSLEKKVAKAVGKFEDWSSPGLMDGYGLRDSSPLAAVLS